jgi:CubicO group peptidase (beta-lactamase class C family)
LRLTYTPRPSDTTAGNETGPPVAPDYTPPQLAQGYATPTRPAAYWHFDALAGTGALRSTPGNLLHFLDQQLRPGSTSLAASIRRTHEEHHQTSDGLALGLG